MSARFDRFMVSNSIGTNRKLRRLPVAQRWVYVAGVLALASQSPIRGALLITDGEPVTAEDIAQEATVKVSEARAALASFRRFGMLDTDAHGVEWVHDWDAMNRDPKPSDSPEARRARKRAQRDREQRDRHADVTRDITDCHTPEGEVEGEEQHPPNPPLRGGHSDDPFPSRPDGNRKRDSDDHKAAVDDWVYRHFPDSEPGAVVGAVSWLGTRNGITEVTPDALRRFAATSDTWAEPLGLSSKEAA